MVVGEAQNRGLRRRVGSSILFGGSHDSDVSCDHWAIVVEVAVTV
jgi:hypothetical protein